MYNVCFGYCNILDTPLHAPLSAIRASDSELGDAEQIKRHKQRKKKTERSMARSDSYWSWSVAAARQWPCRRSPCPSRGSRAEGSNSRPTHKQDCWWDQPLDLLWCKRYRENLEIAIWRDCTVECLFYFSLFFHLGEVVNNFFLLHITPAMLGSFFF